MTGHPAAADRAVENALELPAAFLADLPDTPSSDRPTARKGPSSGHGPRTALKPGGSYRPAGAWRPFGAWRGERAGQGGA